MNTEIAQLLQLESDIGTNYVEQSLGYKPDTNEYGLTETEFLVIRMLVSNGQSSIQQHLYEKRQPTRLESLLCGYLDAALKKIPKEDTVGYVYRVTSQNILSPSDKSSLISYPAYLTASKKWLSTSDNCSLIIRLAGRTKARSVYKAYEMNKMLPEEQVEFPRNTKFYVEDYEIKDGNTIVKLLEMPDYMWPAEKLTNNVSDFFNEITTIDIREAVKQGLNSEIHLTCSKDGKAINSLCTDEGEVFISPTFAQALWNLCYIGLSLSDKRIVGEELAKEGVTLDSVCREIIVANCNEPRALYLLALQNAYNTEDLLYQMTGLLSNQYLHSDDVFLGQIDVLGELEKRVGGLYMTGMGCVLLHELTHYYKRHFERLGSESRKSLEMEADSLAFESLLALDGGIRQTAILGGLAPLLLGFYMNPTMLPLQNYYREDVRLFTQYDKIDDKRRASVFVANVLSDWLERYHNRKLMIHREHEEETVEEIRSILNGM